MKNFLFISVELSVTDKLNSTRKFCVRNAIAMRSARNAGDANFMRVLRIACTHLPHTEEMSNTRYFILNDIRVTTNIKKS